MTTASQPTKLKISQPFTVFQGRAKFTEENRDDQQDLSEARVFKRENILGCILCINKYVYVYRTEFRGTGTSA